MARKKIIPYGHQSIDRRDVAAVTHVLKSDWLTQGPTGAAFEEALARYCEARYAVAFSSGTAALHGAFSVAGLTRGDEFITSPLTFAATSNAGLYVGAMPVFADIDERGNLDPASVALKINKKTKAIVVVDYAGYPVDLDEFRLLAKKHNLLLIEDACQALGATYHAQKIGSLSDLTVFSFHPVKSMTTGEGGAVVTNDRGYYERLKSFRTHGIVKSNFVSKTALDGDWYQEMQSLGFNYRMTDMQASLGISQLKKVDTFLSKRYTIAARYDRELSHLIDRLILPNLKRNSTRSAFHLYVIRVMGGPEKRLYVFNQMRKAGIGVQVHHIPVYWHPYYQRLGYAKGLCPRAEKFYGESISLPIFPTLSATDQKKVIDTLSQIL
ncbi:MAG: DegT/DnrJ/EryC1/StrS aminotransferase [Parcubacteria group bacterium Greene0416_79]|nr:MAG: DegT/DnrJ/EryC1/StrS aminotransferase [Parcubacteria group bacterium Greene0416_79]